MYWSRTGSFLDIFVWLILSLGWWSGGWLICVHVFHLRARERLFAGMAVGFILFLVGSNFLGLLMPIQVAFRLASLGIASLGFGFAWRSKEQIRLPFQDLLNWKQILVFFFLMTLFTLINRGLTIFDEYWNLPLVGMIAQNGLPAHLYLDSARVLDYHYGLHLFAASLVDVGGFLVWSALDISRAFAVVLTLQLAYLWLRRYSKQKSILLIGLALVLLSSGSRWLLLLLPRDMLASLSAGIQLVGSARETAPDLLTALLSPWNIESGSPTPFPFAFANGIFPPLSLALGGTGALPQLTLFTLLVLGRYKWQPLPALVYGVLLASLGFTGEFLLVIVWSGFLLSMLVDSILERSTERFKQWLWVLTPTAFIVPVMGGVLTGIARTGFAKMLGYNTMSNLAFTGMSLRIPPSLTSSHLGQLVLTDPGNLIVALAEIGPAWLLAPWISLIGWRRLKRGNWLWSGMALAALIGFLSPLFVKLSYSDRDISRILGMGLYIWVCLSLPYLSLVIRRGKRWLRASTLMGAIVLVVAGLGLMPAQIIAITQTHFTYFIDQPDVLMSKMLWNQLGDNPILIDLSIASRPATLFGASIGHAYQDVMTPYPDFESLLRNPDPVRIANAGYTHIYLDRKAWKQLNSSTKQAYERICVQLVTEFYTPTSDFRRLYDVRECLKEP